MLEEKQVLRIGELTHINQPNLLMLEPKTSNFSFSGWALHKFGKYGICSKDYP